MNNKKIFFLAMVMLSSFSSYLLVSKLHLPCLIELFLIPLWFYYRRTISLPFKDVMILTLFLISGTFVGLLNPLFDLGEILQMTRCFFLGGIGFVLLKNNEIFSTKGKLLALSFGAFVGDLLNSYITMRTTLGGVEDDEYAVDINIILSILWAILIIFYKKSKWLLLLLVLVPLLCFLSVSRGITVFFIVGIILSLMLKILNNPVKIFVSFTFLVLSFFALSYLYDKGESTIQHFSPSMHFRLYTKVKKVGKLQADKGRIAPYLWLKDHLDYYTFPRGFQGKKFFKEKSGSFVPVRYVWDSAYLELIYTFGLLPFLMIFFVCLYKLYKMYIYFHCTDNPIFAVACVMLILLGLEHFFGYGLYRSPFTVFSNGALLGFIWRISTNPDSVSSLSLEKTEIK